jgi:hypothetical protein
MAKNDLNEETAHKPADSKSLKKRLGAKVSWMLAIPLLAIAIALSLLFFFQARYPRGRVLVSSAMTDISTVRLALEVYRMEFGSFPDGSNVAVYRALCGENPKELVFLDISPKRISNGSELMDPWENPYRIDLSDPRRLRIHSAGPNGIDEKGAGGSDDIVSW